MNRKFILIGLLLGTCFAFTVLQVATVEAQQCDAGLACDPTTGTCCNQCDPGPACVAGDPHAIPCCSSGGDVRDPRGPGDVRDPRGPGDVRDPRGGDPRGGDPRVGGDTAPNDRPWRDILKNCRQMKKRGALSRAMKQECKAARKLKKESRQ